MTGSYLRYAVYFAPRKDTELARFGREWLGVDPETGVSQPAPTPFVTSPRRYGFHATLKAPMRLAEESSYEPFRNAVKRLAGTLEPVELGRLQLKRIGPFLALAVDTRLHEAVSGLAWQCVCTLDRFRAPLNEAERERRTGLSTRQSDYLEKWGYPYVGTEFRFHMTLTSALRDPDLEKAAALLSGEIPREEVMLDSLSIFADPGVPEPFRLVERFDLTR